MDTVRLLLKVFVPSLGVSWAIKALGPSLHLAPTVLSAAIAITLPPVVIALCLWTLSPSEHPR